jgi:hypothetical protein
MTGGVEFFDEQMSPAAMVDNLSSKSIPCQKDYMGCVYSAQGSIMCNLKGNNGVSVKDKIVQEAQMNYLANQMNNMNVRETFVPGMGLGGLPNIPSVPGINNLQT